MSLLISPVNQANQKQQSRLPESTGVLGFQSVPQALTVAAVFGDSGNVGASRGGTETTGVNSAFPGCSFDGGFSSGSCSSSGSSSGGGFSATI